MLKSQIIITRDLEGQIQAIKSQIGSGRIHLFAKEDFLVDDARDVIREAYVASEEERYIVLAAKNFNIYSQNALLKILEEPPRNIFFIIIVPSKTLLLPTIRSRLPIVTAPVAKEEINLDLSIRKLDLKGVYDFIKVNSNLKRHEAKKMIEAIFAKAVQEEIRLTEEEISQFTTAYRLLELGARTQNVLVTLMLTLLGRKHR